MRWLDIDGRKATCTGWLCTQNLNVRGTAHHSVLPGHFLPLPPHHRTTQTTILNRFWFLNLNLTPTPVVKVTLKPVDDALQPEKGFRISLGLEMNKQIVLSYLRPSNHSSPLCLLTLSTAAPPPFDNIHRFKSQRTLMIIRVWRLLGKSTSTNCYTR